MYLRFWGPARNRRVVPLLTDVRKGLPSPVCSGGRCNEPLKVYALSQPALSCMLVQLIGHMVIRCARKGTVPVLFGIPWHFPEAIPHNTSRVR